MGEVYKARDLRLNRIVAVKLLHSAGALDDEHRQRFDVRPSRSPHSITPTSSRSTRSSMRCLCLARCFTQATLKRLAILCRCRFSRWNS